MVVAAGQKRRLLARLGGSVVKIGCWTAVKNRQMFLRSCLMQMRLQSVIPNIHYILINGENAEQFDLRCVDDLIQPWMKIATVAQEMTTSTAAVECLKFLLTQDVDLYCKIDSDDIYKTNYLATVANLAQSIQSQPTEAGFCLNLRHQLWFNSDGKGGASIHAVAFNNGLGLTQEEKQSGIVVGAPPTFVFDRRVATQICLRSKSDKYRNLWDDQMFRRICQDIGVSIVCRATAEPVFGYFRHGANACKIAGENLRWVDSEKVGDIAPASPDSSVQSELVALAELAIPTLDVQAGDTATMSNRRLCQLFFANMSIGLKRTGIENASLLRASILESELGIVPTILTSNYDPHFPETRDLLLETGKISSSLRFSNLYNDFQEFPALENQTVVPFEPSEFSKKMPHSSLKGVANTPDFRMFDKSGASIAYLRCSHLTRCLLYINYLDKGKFWRRDTFTPDGCLSRIQFLDGETRQAMFENYLRPNGTLALSLRYKYESGKNQLKLIALHDDKSQLTRVLCSQNELLALWLEEIAFRAGDSQAIFVCDKNRVFYNALLELKRRVSSRPIKLVSVLHSVHTADGFKIRSSRTNANYAEILARPNELDAIVVGTDQQKKDIEERYGQGNYWSIPHACVDSLARSPQGTHRSLHRLVYIARYSEEKRHDLALEAFSRIHDRVPESTLHFYGDGPLQRSIEERVKKMGLFKKVTVNKYIQDVRSVYQQAGFSLLTSKGEGYPLALLESLSNGCPVAAFDVRYGPSQVIRNEVDGFLVSFGDIDRLADLIASALVDAKRHRLMCEAALEIHQRANRTNISSRWKALLSQLTGVK